MRSIYNMIKKSDGILDILVNMYFYFYKVKTEQ